MPWIRELTGLLAAGVLLVVTWLWMLLGQFDETFLPGGLLIGGLIAVESVQVVSALLLTPALLAGVIAGEKDRGTLAMLLASRLTSGEIIVGRLVGSFARVAFFLAPVLPPLVLLAVWCDAGVIQISLLVGLPAAVVIGSGGLAVAASTLARRGRDALLTVYVIEIGLIVASLFAAGQPGWRAWLGSFNPFATLYPLSANGVTQPAAWAVVLWLALGVVGMAVAVWQLWPAHRRQIGGDSRRRKKRRSNPPIRQRPMMWKELNLESRSSFGGFGRWLLWLVTGLLAGGGVAVLAALVWKTAYGQTAMAPWSETVAGAIGVSAMLVLWFSQWMIGMRAVSAISTERQRATWEGILVSPLEGKEIVIAKACGSVNALRWLIAAIVVAWSAAVWAGSMTVSAYLSDLALLVAGGGFMVAIGVAVGIAMRAGNTTRGMATTIGLWMAAAIASAVLAGLMSVIGLLFAMALWATYLLATASSDLFASGPNLPGVVINVFYVTLRVGLYVAATIAIIIWLAARFDRQAGRMGSWSAGQELVRSVKTLLEQMPAPATSTTQERS